MLKSLCQEHNHMATDPLPSATQGPAMFPPPCGRGIKRAQWSTPGTNDTLIPAYPFI